MELNHKTGPDKESCTCPICMYIMIEPVTMPCRHTLCMYCYKQTVAQSNLVCPICRQRISVWARRAAKTNTLIDQEKWVIIQSAFPHKVKRRMEGMAEGPGDMDKDYDDDDDSDDQDCETYLRKLKELSKPGEIRQEYDAAMRKLQQQRELEAKREEEASAALIQALQEEEAKEIERLRKEREDSEMLGLAVAQQIQEASFEELKSRGILPSPQGTASNPKPNNKTPIPKVLSKSKNGSKQNRPLSASGGKMNTLNNFFSPVPRTPSAPPLHMQLSKFEQKKNKELSPYPYACISPKDKIFYGLSALEGSANSTPRPRSNSSSSNEAPGLRDEHSYSTASASIVDLTNSAVAKELCGTRTDVPVYDLSRVKSEPEDIFGPGPSGLNRYLQGSPVSVCSSQGEGCGNRQLTYLSPTVGSFQPIVAHQRTPPKQQANGDIVEVPVMRTTARKIILSKPMPSSITESELPYPSTAKMKSATGFGKTSAAARINKRAGEALKNSTKTTEAFGSPKTISTQQPSSSEDNHSVVVAPANSKVPNPITVPSVTSGSEALTICIEDEPELDPEYPVQESSKTRIGQEVKNRSDQENSAIAWDKELLSTTTWGFTPTSEQPLKVSSCSNRTVTAGGDCSFSEASSGSSENKHSTRDGSFKGKTLQVNLECIKGKKRAMVGKNVRVKCKKSAASAATTSLDSFVQRKKRTFSSTTTCDREESLLTQEEKDHMLALQLQEMYQEFDKRNIEVDRFSGSENEYSFRKKRKV